MRRQYRRTQHSLRRCDQRNTAGAAAGWGGLDRAACGRRATATRGSDCRWRLCKADPGEQPTRARRPCGPGRSRQRRLGLRNLRRSAPCTCLRKESPARRVTFATRVIFFLFANFTVEGRRVQEAILVQGQRSARCRVTSRKFRAAAAGVVEIEDCT